MYLGLQYFSSRLLALRRELEKKPSSFLGKTCYAAVVCEDTYMVIATHTTYPTPHFTLTWCCLASSAVHNVDCVVFTARVHV